MNINFLSYLYAIPAILLSLSFHEMAHAFVSYRLGDPTAKRLGRLTMNPLKHLDPLGTLMLLVSLKSGFGFGWAKPVPIDPTYYRNYKRGTVLVSLAGPLSNLLLAFIFFIPTMYIAVTSGISSYANYNDFSTASVLFNICSSFYMINIGLAIFNLLPIPPLDGSKILTAILPVNLYFRLMQYENYIGMIFLAVMFLKPEVLTTIMSPLRTGAEWIILQAGLPILRLIT